MVPVKMQLLPLLLVIGCVGTQKDGFLGPNPAANSSSVVLSPRAVVLAPGESQQFSLTASWNDDSTIVPAVSYSATGGSITRATGLYTAGQTAGLYHVIATSMDGTRADTSVVAVETTGSEITINPGTPIQPIVAQSPLGAHFLLKAGVYAQQLISPKDSMQFRGEPGTVLDGQGVTAFAFTGTARALWIRDIEITGYAPPHTDLGAIQGFDGQDWILQNMNVHNNSGYGANLRGHFMVIGGTFHHNARLGIGVTEGSGGLIEGADLSFNNPDSSFAPLWEAGGVKVSSSSNVIVRGCHAHHNVGPGIWYDIDNRGSFVVDNLVTDNSYAGILYEISYSGVIQGNTVLRNGTPEAGVFGAGILIASSGDVEIHHNSLQANRQGIVAIQQDRGAGQFGPYLVENLSVHDNDVELKTGAAGLLDAIGTGSILNSSSNRFDGNRYDVTGNPLPFYTGGPNPDSIAAWQALGQDLTSTFTGP